ncbi:membrane protein [Cladorrhinum sp. PSN332]|nr:membrane protein [Cladorrhinum sp. PSN332]
MASSTDYEIACYEHPGLRLPKSERDSLQKELSDFAADYLNPLPRYNIFDTSSPVALDDKVIVTARVSDTGALAAFVSASLIPIPGLDSTNPKRAVPVLNTGLTIIHHAHRKSHHVKRLLFGTLFLHMFARFPEGMWLVSLAEVITSLVQIARYTQNCFPCPPSWPNSAGSAPSKIHLQIAREISLNHRRKFLINRDAKFDEERFVFLESNNTAEGMVFMKDVDDRRYWHRDEEATGFFRGFFRRNMGDEVLQVGWLEPEHVVGLGTREGFKRGGDGIVSRL